MLNARNPQKAFPPFVGDNQMEQHSVIKDTTSSERKLAKLAAYSLILNAISNY